MAELEQAIEANGANIEAAIATGLTRLGIERDEVEIEVLGEGSQGVFGLGVRQARVRLTPKPGTTPRQIPEATTEPESESGETVALSIDEDATEEICRGVMVDILALLGMEDSRVQVRQAEPAVGEKNPPLVISVRGPGTDTLIGHRGKTLAALQHITRLIVGQEIGGWIHLVVDVEGFKARRENTLRHLAQQVAEQVERTNRMVMLEPMPPNERRIVHLTLRDHPHVTTESIGEGDRRKVTIIPR